MTEINRYRVEDGETVELPGNISESGIHVHNSDWLYVVEDEGTTTQTYRRHIDVLTANPNPPKASNVIVLRFNEDVFDYLTVE